MKKGTPSEYMTVPEMRKLLGLKKTESYWLYKKGYFDVCETPFGYRINRKSFEKWYKNQLHYKKVTGEPPGAEIHKWAYLPAELVELLDISECYVYDLLIQEHIETVIVDRRKVIPKKSFHEWYENQDHFLLPEDRKRNAHLMESTISMPEFASLLHVARKDVYELLREPQYKSVFQFVEVAGQKRITVDSIRRWYDLKNPDRLPSYISVADAAILTDISETQIRRFTEKNFFQSCHVGKQIRIEKESLFKWIENNKERR